MNNNIKDKINGYGTVLRFITPVLITVAIFILSNIRSDVLKLDAHFTNHLEHHQDLEVGYERRLSRLEMKVNMGTNP